MEKIKRVGSLKRSIKLTNFNKTNKEKEGEDTNYQYWE